MARVLQVCLSTGWGGLEMVICDFHKWLRQNQIDAKILCLKGSLLQLKCANSGFGHDIFASSPGGILGSFRTPQNLRTSGPADMILFHRQQEAKLPGLRRLPGKKSVLCHTFYGVQKKDLWHRFVFSCIDQWIVLTPTQKENLLRTISIDEEKIRVIPNGVDLQRFKPLPCQKDSAFFRIGLIARLDPQKGQDIALKALKKLGKPNVRLHFFGTSTPDEPDYQPQLQALTQELGLQEQVVFEGHQENLETRIPEMDLIWMPSHQETFGRCLLEAMACGRPVIASNAGGVPDIIQDEFNGLLFETKQPDHLAERTLYLMENPQLRDRLIKEALSTVSTKYDSERIWNCLFDWLQAPPLPSTSGHPHPLKPRFSC